MNKKNLYLISTIVVVFVGVVLYTQAIKPSLDNRTVTTIVPMRISNDELSLEFTYPSGEEAYTLIEPPIPTTTSDGIQKAYLIMDTQSYIEYQSQSEDKTIPPTVSIFVFKNSELTESEKDISRTERLQAWAEMNTRYSSYNLKLSEPEYVEVDGVKAIRYRTDGQYQQEVYLVSYSGYNYIFTGQYNAETDDIYKMYNEMIQSVFFN